MSKRTKAPVDPEIVEFEEALLRGVDQAMRGEGRVNSAEQIAARRGRPAGSLKSKPKVPTTIRFDQDILDALRSSGRGWQTRVNDIVREWLTQQSERR